MQKLGKREALVVLVVLAACPLRVKSIFSAKNTVVKAKRYSSTRKKQKMFDALLRAPTSLTHRRFELRTFSVLTSCEALVRLT